MIRMQKSLFLVLLLAVCSNVGWGQTDMSGKWNVRLQIIPEFGTGTFDSVWEVEQNGKKVTGSITEIASGKVTKFTDGYRGKSGSLGFTIKSQYRGQPATIEVNVKVKDGAFAGLYDIVTASVDDHDLGAIAMSGNLVGRLVAAKEDSLSKKDRKKKEQDKKSNGSKGQDSKTEVLFDGSNLDNFRGYKKEKIGKGWTVDNGTLHFNGKRSGDIITYKQYGSFELTFDWKVSEGGNSGVMYRVTLGDTAASRSGIEYQILDNDKHKDGKHRKTCAGSLYALYPPGSAVPKAPGEWNVSKIVVDGDKVQHWLNGEKVVEAEIDSDDWKKRISESKFAKWKKFGKSKRGHIAFQDHKNPTWFRNIKIKSLD